jgi:hypothetical protein
MTDNGSLIAAALDGITNSILSMGLLFVLITLGLGLMITALWLKRGPLAWSALIPWVLFGFTAYTTSGTPNNGVWDVYYGAFWMSFGLALLCMVEAVLIKPKPEDAKDDLFAEDITPTEKYSDRLWRGTRAPRIGRRGEISRRSR